MNRKFHTVAGGSPLTHTNLKAPQSGAFMIHQSKITKVSETNPSGFIVWGLPSVF
nr:MAG TPA: hypothetical protein [Caudoviricetes sp.]